MIFGDVRHWDAERRLYPPPIAKAVDFIRRIDFDRPPKGRLEIDGDDMYAGVSESETVVKHDFVFVGESHEKYVDLHYCASGGELIVFSRRCAHDVVVEDRLFKEDALLYSKIHDEMRLVMTPGRFVVFFPDDIHLAGYRSASAEVTKVVAKIAVRLFGA